MNYAKSIRKGICPECGNKVIKVEEMIEYERDNEGKEVPKTYPVIRCTRCGKSWIVSVLRD